MTTERSGRNRVSPRMWGTRALPPSARTASIVRLCRSPPYSVRGGPALDGEERATGNHDAGNPGRERDLRGRRGRTPAQIPLAALPDHVSKKLVSHRGEASPD